MLCKNSYVALVLYTINAININIYNPFVSATWPQGVRRLAQSYMKNPIQVFVGSLDLAAVHSVTQRIYMVNEDEKTDMVSSILKVLIKVLMLSYVSEK